MVAIIDAAPIVSIVMPVYNGGDYFALALDSALKQTYSRTEIVVVDDGSQDGGASQRLAESSGSHVRYIYQENQGVAGALNTALANMTGDVFCWLSHDDLFEPYKTEAQVAYHGRLGKQDAVLFSDYDLIDAHGQILQQVRVDRSRLLRAPIAALLTGSINGCTIFAPAEVMQAIGPFNPCYRYTQDYRLWNELIKRYEFFHQPRSLVRYRVHPEQGSNKPEALSEGDDLWIAMMDDRCESERVQMMGSTFRFYDGMAQHLATSPYRRAETYARQHAVFALSETLTSVIIPVTRDDNEGSIQAVVDWAGRHAERSKLDLIIATDRPGPLASTWPNGARQMRFSSPNPLSDLDLVNRALPEARGSYISFARPTARRPYYDPGQIAVRMQQNGLTEAAVTADSEAALTYQDFLLQRSRARSLSIEDVVIHRSHVDSGFTFPPAVDARSVGIVFQALARWKPLTLLSMSMA